MDETPLAQMKRGKLKLDIQIIDHIVLTVIDIKKTCNFYSEVLGMEKIKFGNNRKALKFNNQKINLHEYGDEFEPKADIPTPGSVDICFITSTPLIEAIDHITSMGVDIIDGPVERAGANGKVNSIYFKDPDGNLIELSNYK